MDAQLERPRFDVIADLPLLGGVSNFGGNNRSTKPHERTRKLGVIFRGISWIVSDFGPNITDKQVKEMKLGHQTLLFTHG